jgi:hypothetical protein
MMVLKSSNLLLHFEEKSRSGEKLEIFSFKMLEEAFDVFVFRVEENFPVTEAAN